MPHAEQSLTFVVGAHTPQQSVTHACGIRNLLQISMGLQAAAATVLLCSYAYCEGGNIIQSSKLAVTLDAFFLCCDFIVIHHISCTYLFISFHAGTNKSTFPFGQLQDSLPGVFHRLSSLLPPSSPSSIPAWHTKTLLLS